MPVGCGQTDSFNPYSCEAISEYDRPNLSLCSVRERDICGAQRHGDLPRTYCIQHYTSKSVMGIV